jgi:hypothetical protein
MILLKPLLFLRVKLLAGRNDPSIAEGGFLRDSTVTGMGDRRRAAFAMVEEAELVSGYKPLPDGLGTDPSVLFHSRRNRRGAP